MNTSKNLLDAIEQYIDYLNKNKTSQQAGSRVKELNYMLTNTLLPGLGYDPDAIAAAYGDQEFRRGNTTSQIFMRTQPLTCLLEARTALQKGFELLPRSQKTQANHRRSLEHFLAWCVQQSWWPSSSPLQYAPNSKDFCMPSCQPPHKVQGKLTNRSKQYCRYTLSPREISPSLQAELDQFKSFLVSPEHPYRKTDAVKEESTQKNYMKDVLLMLGWFHHYQGVPLEQLCFNLLIPREPKNHWKFLPAEHRNNIWQPHVEAVNSWLTNYFQFLKDTMESTSPHTKKSRLSTLIRLGEFQYYKDIDFASDYEQIPVLQVIANRIKRISPKIRRNRQNRKYVADQAMKWPDEVPGQPALTTIHRQLLDPLRFDCRPKSSANKLRTGSGIADSEKVFFAWFLLAGMPTRRQNEHRNLKLALCCPIQRPPDVPVNGNYHPLPPQNLRDKRADGTIKDLYLCKVYSYQGQSYKEGLWVIDARDAKEWDTYGAQSIVIKNHLFRDGTQLYDYIEHYLYGWWLPGGRKNQQIYDWWQPDLKGLRGRWVSHGRASFEPCDACYLTQESELSFWCWGYFFVRFQSGLPYSGSTFSEMIRKAAERTIGKSITPHIMRSIWATWAYQVRINRNGEVQIGLTNPEKESLAYAMGMSLKTLKNIYERCAPDEKRRAIEEVIDTKLLGDFIILATTPSLTPSALEIKLKGLTESQRQSLRTMMLEKKQHAPKE